MEKKWGPRPVSKPRRRLRPFLLGLVYAGVIVIGLLGGRLMAKKWSQDADAHRDKTFVTDMDAATISEADPSTKEDDAKLNEDSNSMFSVGATRAFVHTLEDRVLIARALQVEQAPPESPQAVAFLFLTNEGNLPLAPLWAEFFKGHEGKYSIYLHSPGNTSKYSNINLPEVFHGRRIPGKTFGWGHIDVLEAQRRLLASALLEPSNSRFVLVSESCVPLFNFSFTHSYLTGTPYSFVKAHSPTSVDGPEMGLMEWNSDFLPLITLRQWRMGTPWFVLDRELANLVIGDFNFFMTFSRACDPQKYCHSDWHYIQTMLFLLKGHKLLNRTLTWDDWSGGGITPSWFSGPDVLPAGNVSKSLILRLGRDNRRTCLWKDGVESTCLLFARQFYPSSLHPLLKIFDMMK